MASCLRRSSGAPPFLAHQRDGSTISRVVRGIGNYSDAQHRFRSASQQRRFALGIAGSRTNNAPHQLPICLKRRPPHLQEPIFNVFHRGGLCFGHQPLRVMACAPLIGGNCIIRDPTRRRHADSRLLMLQNPHDRRRGKHARTTPEPMRIGWLDADRLSACG